MQCSAEKFILLLPSVCMCLYSEIIQVPTAVPTVYANYSMLLYMAIHAHCTQ